MAAVFAVPLEVRLLGMVFASKGQDVMRICLINEFFYPDDTGGTGNVLSDLTHAIRQAHPDIEIEVVTSRNRYRRTFKPVQGPGRPHKPWHGRIFRFARPESRGPLPLANRDKWAGIEIFRLGTPHPNNRPLPARMIVNFMFTIAVLLFLLRRRRYDLVLVTTAPPIGAMAASLYRAMTGTPYAYIIYDLEPDLAVRLGVVPKNNPFALAFQMLQKSYLQSAAKVIALGRCMQSHLVSNYRLAPERIEVIPIGYDPASVWPATKETRFRAEHGLNGKFIVLYSGNLGRHHDFDTVLNAAKVLKKKSPDVRFVFVGGGFQEEHVAKRIADEKIDNAALYPFVAKEDLPDLLATADLSIVTLEKTLEGLCVPSKFYSVLASGRPVLGIVSPETEIGMVIDEAKCGVRVNHGESDQLADSIIRLVEDVQTLERMGVNARKALIERFSMAHVAECYHDAFQAIVGPKSIPVSCPSLVESEAIETT